MLTKLNRTLSAAKLKCATRFAKLRRTVSKAKHRSFHRRQVDLRCVRQAFAHQIGSVHALESNHSLSREQYALAIALVGRIQQLYNGAPEYVERKGLDPSLVFPGNEWADIVPVRGLKFRTDYNDINFLRLNAPFAGYHLTILDRIDDPHFPAPWTKAFVEKLGAEGIPDDIAERTRALYDPADRLMPVVSEYLDHVRNVPSRYIVGTPRLFGEVGVEVDGVLVNPDVSLCQSRINGMLCAGVLDKLDADIARRGRARVLEVGPGYGALAYALQSIFGERLEYICVDLPSSLYHSTIYLSTLAGGEGCHVLTPGDSVPDRFNFLFIANFMIGEVSDRLGPIDLALNTLSFTEMTAAQVRSYGENFESLLGKNAVVFEENAMVRPHHTDIKAIFSEIFPYRKRVSSDIVLTKNWCQDVWSKRYIGSIFDRGDFTHLMSGR
jgi:hypothetical protein